MVDRSGQLHGVDRKLDIALPGGVCIVLLIELELSSEASAADLWHQLETARDELRLAAARERVAREEALALAREQAPG